MNHPAEWAREFDREFNGELWLGCEGDLEPQSDRVELKDFIRTLLLKQRDETLEEAAKVADNFHVDMKILGIKVTNRVINVHSDMATGIRQLKSKQEKSA